MRFYVMEILASALLMSLMPLSGAVSLNSTGDLLTGSNISIICTIPTFTGTAGWKNPSVSTGAIKTCTSGFCSPTSATYPQYTFSATANTFTLNIFGVTLNDSRWTCEHDVPSGSATIQLDLKVAPTTSSLTESGGVYTCTVSCGYQKDDVYITAKLNGTIKTETLSSLTAESTPACTSPESAYSAIVPTTFFTQDGDLYCETGINGYPASATSNSLQVKANPDPNPDCPCTGETVLLSLSIAIMCMVLMHAWLVFLFTKGIIKWNIPTVSECDNEKSPVNIIVVTIAISLCCVVGMVLCAVGMSICQKCTSSDDNTGLILAIVGFVLVVVGLVVDILYVCIFQKKTAKCDQRNRPDGQEDNTFKKKETLPPIEDKSTDNSPRSRGSPTSASKIQTKINKMSGQVSDSNESDGGETARSKLGNVPLGRKLPPLQPGAEQSQPSEDTTGVKKLKKKKKKKNKEEQKNDKVMLVEHTGNAFHDVDINLPHQVPATSLHGQTPEEMKLGTQPPDTDNVSFQNVISNQKDLIWIGQQTKPIYALDKLTMRWETTLLM